MLFNGNSSIAFGILNWKKPYTPKIVKALAKQTACPSVRVWNNNPAYQFADQFPEAADFCDVIIDANINLRCSVFSTLFEDCDAEFIGKIDDDVMLADNNVVADCLEYLKDKDHDMIVGGFGVVLEDGKEYRECKGYHKPPKVDTNVDIVNSRFWVLRKSALWKAPRTATNNHGDVSLCGFLADGRKQFHVLPGLLHERLISLKEYKMGSWQQPGHFEAREEERLTWFQ